MTNENVWDTSHFIQQYTAKSSHQRSPLKNEIFNLSREISMSPERLAEELSQDDVFCTQENLESRLQYLDQELTMLGYPSILSKPNNKTIMERFDITKLVNGTYELLRKQQINNKVKEDLQERHIRSENDNEYLLQNQVRLKQDLENMKREAALLRCREKDEIEKCRILQQDVKSEREEKRKMRSDVEHLKKQFYHESKRTEKEMTRLKEKIHQILNDKTQERKIGIDILNALQRADRKRSTWKNVGNKGEEDMYKMIISNYEEKEKNLLSENSQMRELIGDLQNDLQLGDSSTASEVNEDELKQLQMPFYLIKQDVETRLKNLVLALKERTENKQHLRENSHSSINDDSFASNKQNEELEKKLQECKVVIAAQEKLIQNMNQDYSREQFEKMLLTLVTSGEDYKSTEKRFQLLKEEEKKLENERKKFTEYVMQVAKEKEELEKERVEFYMHCISTPVINAEKKKKYRDHINNNTHSTAKSTFTPANHSRNGIQIKTPSTAELYKFMSLKFDNGISGNRERPPSLDGSYTAYESIDSGTGSTPSSLKLQEHADKVRRAVEERKSKSPDVASSK